MLSRHSPDDQFVELRLLRWMGICNPVSRPLNIALGQSVRVDGLGQEALRRYW